MGPLLKGAGAIAFLLDYLFRGSPASFLLFAASDGSAGAADAAGRSLMRRSIQLNAGLSAAGSLILAVIVI